MANRKRSPRNAPPRKRPRARGKVRKAPSLLQRLFYRPQAEFKPDATGTKFTKLLHLTEQQQKNILRWTLYVAVCILALVVQDVIMSRVSIFGATTDLPAAIILLLAVIEGCETGSMVALAAATLYYFTGTAPGPYCVAMFTIIGMAAGLFRQKYLHRSAGSIVVCTGVAVILYEIGLYVMGLFMGLTRWDRIGIFFVTGLLSCVMLIPMYMLVFRIGQIGGNTWKE